MVAAALGWSLTAAAEGGRGGAAGRLFDVRAAEQGAGARVARLFSRATDRDRYRSGWELAVGEQLRWTQGAAVIEGSLGTGLRLLPGEGTLSVAQHTGLAGLRLGPVNLLGGVVLSLLNLGVVRGALDAGMFWPRAVAAVSIALGPLRVAAQAHVEYAWYWWGPDQYVRGVGVVLSLRRPRTGPEWQAGGVASER